MYVLTNVVFMVVGVFIGCIITLSGLGRWYTVIEGDSSSSCSSSREPVATFYETGGESEIHKKEK